MEIGIGLLDISLGYIQQGLEWVRGILNGVANWIPWGNPELVVTIIFLLSSIWLGRMLVSRFVTRPFSVPYVFYTIIIIISIFLNLMYL